MHCLWSDSQQSIFWKEVFVHIVPLSLRAIHTASFYNAEQIEYRRRRRVFDMHVCVYFLRETMYCVCQCHSHLISNEWTCEKEAFCSQCVDDRMKKVSDDNDDNVSVYIFDRQFTVFFWHPLRLFDISICTKRRSSRSSNYRLVRERESEEYKCGRVMFILESSIRNKMNNIYSSERSNELKQSVLHLLRKIKSRWWYYVFFSPNG